MKTILLAALLLSVVSCSTPDDLDQQSKCLETITKVQTFYSTSPFQVVTTKNTKTGEERTFQQSGTLLKQGGCYK